MFPALVLENKAAERKLLKPHPPGQGGREKTRGWGREKPHLSGDTGRPGQKGGSRASDRAPSAGEP